VKRAIFLLGLSLAILTASPAQAHPLGNFTTNVFLGLEFTSEATKVLLVVDMAEVPAFRERTSSLEAEVYAATQCNTLREDLSILRNGMPMALSLTTSTVAFPPGQGGLTTLRLECTLTGPVVATTDQLEIDNRVYADRLGWAEIVVRATGLAASSDAPAESTSGVLTQYPPGPPLDQRQALVSIGSPSSTNQLQPSPYPVVGLAAAVTESAGTVALVAALVLGVGHALAPGHGKTLVAAYLVGQRGRPRHAVLLGLSVAISHTLGVAILGLLTLTASTHFQPDRIYPWLASVSAGVVTIVGLTMLMRAYSHRAHHHQHDHSHPHDHPHPQADRTPKGWRSLAALGLAGGLVPSASAVVLLLGGISTGRPLYGLALVAAFGLGMSLTLIGAGLAALGINRVGQGFLSSDLAHRWQHAAPKLAGGAVTCIGLVLVWNAAVGVL
jgi:ABC-type nickel/cobalt efflux system permease component RcnA